MIFVQGQIFNFKTDLFILLFLSLIFFFVSIFCLYFCLYFCHLCDPMDFSMPGLPVFHYLLIVFHFLSHVQSFVTSWTTYSMPGFPILHHLLEPAQTCVRWISEAIQPSSPLSSPFPPAFNLSQHQGLF